jgi:hypothetical protein
MWFGLGDAKSAYVCMFVCWVELFVARSYFSFFFCHGMMKKTKKKMGNSFRDFYTAGSREYCDKI